MDEANPYGKTAEEIDRSNGWFRVAVALGKQDDYIEMLETERRYAVHTLLELKRAEDAGEICAMEDATQSVMCLYEPLHKGRHTWEPMPAEEPAEEQSR